MTVILISAGLVSLILLTIIRRIGRRLTERQIIQSQHIVNQAMNTVLRQVSDQLSLQEVTKPLRTTLVANIWGHEVMAFEGRVPVLKAQPVGQVQQILTMALQRYEEEHPLTKDVGQPAALVITDIWYQERAGKVLLHLDIAHVINAETAAYLRDLAKLNQPL